MWKYPCDTRSLSDSAEIPEQQAQDFTVYLYMCYSLNLKIFFIALEFLKTREKSVRPWKIVNGFSCTSQKYLNDKIFVYKQLAID